MVVKNKPYPKGSVRDPKILKRGKVGKKTKLITKANRPVYKTKSGEYVSEKGVTIPIGADTTTGEQVWLNAPSIYEGYEHTEDEIINRFQGDLIPRDEMSFHGSSEEGITASKERSKSLYDWKKSK